MHRNSVKWSLLTRALPVAYLLVSAACGTDAKPAAEIGLPPKTSSAQAPNVFQVAFETSRGRFVLEAHRDWAPRGVDRLYQLVQASFFDNTRFFRAVSGFMVQFGIHGDPGVNAAWQALNIPDDSVTQSNKRGYMSFAMGGPGSRTTQVFINLVDNVALDGMGFPPVGVVTEGMAVVDSLYTGYGEAPPGGFGPEQELISSQGNAYLERDFPKLDFIRTARLLPAAASAGRGDSAR